MSTNHDEEELELRALQRQLDDAFETTRPRPGFDDELWLRMQGTRPARSRLRDALDGLVGGIRAVPVVPAAAVATVLVLALAVGLVGHFTIGGPTGGASTASNYAPAQGDLNAGSFGRLPTPAFNGDRALAPGPASTQANAPGNGGAMRFVWSGKLNLNISSAPVFRYREPSTNLADQFATGLGAVLRDRPSGFLGQYSAADYTLRVRGTVQSPASSPAYYIFASLSMPPVEAAGAGPADQASIFLAQHSLIPEWTYTVEVDSSGDPVKVRYDRQFDAPGYGPAYLVDSKGQRYGLEVDLSANRPVLAMGVLPVSLEIADYRIIAADDAVRAALAAAGSQAVPAATPAPTVQLTQADLVYVLVPAGNHSFYEPAILFSGSYTFNGQTLVKHVLVPAVDPSQRTP